MAIARIMGKGSRNVGLLAAAWLAAAVPATAQLTAGAGRADVALGSTMLPLDGFAAVHDPLAARVLVLGSGKARAAIAVVDQTSMGGDVVDTIKTIVERETHVAAADVLVVASHTFSAPHLFTAAHLQPGMTMSADEQRRAQAYRNAVLAAVTGAARQAASRVAPARIGAGRGVSDVNISRNVPMADGWWLGANPAGPSDKQLDVVRIDAPDGNPLALLIDYPVQSAVMDHSVGTAGKGVSADLGGAAVRHVERQYGDGTVALFLTGAAGDQAPAYVARQYRYGKAGHYTIVDRGDAGYELLDAQGQRLGEGAVHAAGRVATAAGPASLRVTSDTVELDGQDRPRDLQQIRPSRSYPFRVSGKADAPFVVLQIGDIAIVGVQAELSAATGRYIKEHSPFAHTLVATMVNGAAKYMPPAGDYRQITYEAMNSSYAAGSAERFADAIVARLATLHAPGDH